MQGENLFHKVGSRKVHAKAQGAKVICYSLAIASFTSYGFGNYNKDAQNLLSEPQRPGVFMADKKKLKRAILDLIHDGWIHQCGCIAKI